MTPYVSDRGFRGVDHPRYLNPHDNIQILQESSAIGDYDDSWDKPGSSYLWVGADHHLDRDEVRELIGYMKHWLKTGRTAE